jgi:hypothetical protein
MEGHIFRIKVLKSKLDLEGSKKDITNFQYHKTMSMQNLWASKCENGMENIYLFIIFIEMMCIFYL